VDVDVDILGIDIDEQRGDWVAPIEQLVLLSARHEPQEAAERLRSVLLLGGAMRRAPMANPTSARCAASTR